MNDSIFRKESLERVTSPEELNDYIKVSKPGVWVSLVAVIVLLSGICVWGMFGKIETKTKAVVVAKDGEAIVFVDANETRALEKDMTVIIDGNKYKIAQKSTTLISTTDSSLKEAEIISETLESTWLCTAEVSGEIKDGVYDAKVVLEEIKPMSFISN